MDNKLLVVLGILLLQNKDILNLRETNFLHNLRVLDLDDESMERGIEILSRSKKYMKKDERILLSKVESILDLARGIKKLNNIHEEHRIEETNFFRSMDSKDRRSMMVKEILEVFPEEKKASINKALDMKNKMYLLKELIQSEEIGKGLKNLNVVGELLNSREEDDDVEEEE